MFRAFPADYPYQPQYSVNGVGAASILFGLPTDIPDAPYLKKRMFDEGILGNQSYEPKEPEPVNRGFESQLPPNPDPNSAKVPRTMKTEVLRDGVESPVFASKTINTDRYKPTSTNKGSRVTPFGAYPRYSYRTVLPINQSPDD
jgi:hypothetical protein